MNDIQNVALLALVLDLIFGNELREQVFRTLNIVWRVGNRQGRRWITIPIAMWIVVLYIAAATNLPYNTRCYIWLVPALLIGAVWIWWPVVGGVLSGLFHQKNPVVVGVAQLIGWVMAAGGLFVVMPSDRNPLGLLMAFGLILLVTLWDAGGPSVWATRIRTVGIKIAVLLIAWFLVTPFFGGPDEAWKKIVSFGKTVVTIVAHSLRPAPSATVVTSAPVSYQPAASVQPTTYTQQSLPPICPDKVGKVTRLTWQEPVAYVRLFPGCRSQQIALPEGVGFLVVLKDTTNGLTYYFQDGSSRFFNWDVPEANMGDIPGSTFRLRGESLAQVRIFPPGRPSTPPPFPEVDPE